MYYPQPSPGIARELNSWNRSNHPVLNSQPNVGPPPTSPGYAIYANGNVNGLQHHHHQPLQHHHQNSLSQNSLSHYPSPTNAHAHQHVIQPSPASAPGQVIASHWQNQLMKCDIVRSSRSPHHRARASAMASRSVAKSAIPITNPNVTKTPPKDDASLADALAANHPSSMVAPVVAQRPSAPRPPQNNWNSLDMGGVNIKNLPPSSSLFSFTFLTNLFLNHNALSVIPPTISKLRQLELLDLSGNNLSVLPVEMGMLTHLKELYLFDNHLTTIPPELGSLHQLRTLGIEGNPLEAALKNLITKDGTPALISYLRDSCPLPQPPPERVWKSLQTQAERESTDASETFSVMSFNILSEKCATERLYGYTPSWALAWDYRKELIITEILNYEPDFLCLQEVDVSQYEDFFTKTLTAHDYEGVYWPRSRYKSMHESERRMLDGCATFYKTSKYKMVEQHLIEFSAAAMQRQDFKKTDDMFNRVLDKDHLAVICLFESRETGTRFIIANTHLYWGPTYSDVKLVQTALLVEEVERCADSFAAYPPPRLSTESTEETPRVAPTYSDGTKIPVIICGDFNSIPYSGVYDFLANGSVPANHPDFMSHMYGKYTSEGLRHRLSLKSAYAGSTVGTPAGELPMTNYIPSFKDTLEYIWYSAPNIAVNAVLGEVDKAYLEKIVGFPNVHFPSDHICILAEFRVKPQRESIQRSAP